MNKKRILFLLHLPPPIHGSSMVGKWIYESKLINQKIETRYLNLLASKAVNETGKLNLKKIKDAFNLLFRLLYELVFYKPNKIYFALTATGFAFYRDVIFIFFIKLFNIKIIYHLHNKGIKKAATNKFNDILYQYVFRNSKVILLSKSLHEDIKKYVNLENVKICPNGVPDIHEPRTEINKNVIPQILFLSNLIESKGVYVLLEALAILKDRSIIFNANFVGGEGDISKENFEKKIKEFNLNENVKYLGKKYGKDKESILKKTDIFTFPTFYHNETFGLVIIEAMQNAIPVISCPEGGIIDIIENGINGYLVEQRNSIALANAIEKLIFNPDLRMSMGKEGRKKYEKYFTLEIFEKKLLSILEEK